MPSQSRARWWHAPRRHLILLEQNMSELCSDYFVKNCSTARINFCVPSLCITFCTVKTAGGQAAYSTSKVRSVNALLPECTLLRVLSLQRLDLGEHLKPSALCVSALACLTGILGFLFHAAAYAFCVFSEICFVSCFIVIFEKKGSYVYFYVLCIPPATCFTC